MTGVPDQSEQPAPIESVDRALRLVELLRDEDAVSLTEAAERLDVPPSTAHRLLAALMHRDFAVRDGKLYRAGPSLVVRREEPVTVQGLREVFQPALELLHDRVQETAQLLAWEGKDTRFVVGIEPDRIRSLVALAGDVRVTFAGGVATADDVATIDRLGGDAQVGMALYSGAMDLGDAVAAPLTSDRPDGLFPTVVSDVHGRSLWSLVEGLDLAEVAAVGREAAGVDTWADLRDLGR